MKGYIKTPRFLARGTWNIKLCKSAVEVHLMNISDILSGEQTQKNYPSAVRSCSDFGNA